MADQKLKEKITRILRPKFPEDTVDVSDGYQENVHVIVVSRKFQNMHEQEKQDLLWALIDKSDLTEEDKSKISLILPYSPAELK